MSVQNQIKDCPRCGEPIPNREHAGEYAGAISRRDNTTEICSECGNIEAIEDFDIRESDPQWNAQKAWNALRQWHDAMDTMIRDDKRELLTQNPHEWWKYMGLRGVMNDLAKAVLNQDWIAENIAKESK
jgi:hypothetical protein